MQTHIQWRAESRIDWNAWMRAFLLLALTALVIRLVATGQIKWYVNPKFTWFTASAGFGLVLMAAGEISRAVRSSRAGSGYFMPLRSRLYIAVGAVICVGFLVKPTVFGADLAAKQGMNITKRSAAQAAAPVTPDITPAPAPGVTAPGVPEPGAAPPGQTVPGVTPPAVPPDTGPAPLPPSGFQGALPTLQGNTAVVTPSNFVAWMQEFYDSPAKYAGKRVSIEGFVFHPPQTTEQEFAITRLVVTCHVAHAYPDGLLTTVPGQNRPAQDIWYRAEGLLEQITFQGTTTLRIKVDKLTPIAEPADPYIYPR